MSNLLNRREKIANNFDEAYTAIIYRNSTKKLASLLTSDTIEYFNKFESSVLEDLQSNLEDLEDLEDIQDVQKAIDEVNNLDITDYSSTTEKILLDVWDFYRDEYLQYEIDRL